ncbi:hypothetical protein [Brucella cytisi]|uniref:hypothetical protein n=1 Tax=Brucella cytisi TaxID=407152 RepID=UPI00169BDF77|nr:hypothetical protein [Brucella cytisi]
MAARYTVNGLDNAELAVYDLFRPTDNQLRLPEITALPLKNRTMYRCAEITAQS